MNKMDSTMEFIYTYTILLSNLLYHGRDTSTMESYCPFTYIYVRYPTVHPILLYNEQDG